jgi:hypothetical protein
MAAHLAREQEHVTHANPCCPTRPFHCCARWIVVQGIPDYAVPMLAPPPFLPIEIEEPVVTLPAVRVHVQPPPLSPFPPAVFSTPLSPARPYPHQQQHQPQPQLVEELVLRPATTLPHSIDSGEPAVRSTPIGHAAVRLPPLASSSSSGMATPNFLNPSITGASRFFSALDLPDKAAELTRELPRTPSPARMAVADARQQQTDANKRFFGADLTIPAAGGDRARPQLSPQARVFKAALYDLEIPSSVRMSPQRSPVRFVDEMLEHRPTGPSRTSTRPSRAAPPSSAGGADSDTDVELDADFEPSMGALPTLDEPVERPFDHDPAQQQHRPQQQQEPPQVASTTSAPLSVAPIIVQPHKKRRMSAIEREQMQRAAGVPMLAAAPPPKPSSVATSPQASRPVSPAAARPAPRSPASPPSSSSPQQQQRPSSPFSRWQVQVETPGVAAAPSAVPAAALSSPFESLETTIAAHGPFAGSPLAAQGAHWEPPPPATDEELFPPPAQPQPHSPRRQQSAPDDVGVADDEKPAAAVQVRPALEFEPGLAPLPKSFAAPDE